MIIILYNFEAAMQEQLPEARREDPGRKGKLFGLLRALGVPCSKTVACKHGNGCIEDALRGSTRVALSAYLIKLGISLLLQMRALFKTPSRLPRLLVEGSTVRFALFAGCFVGVFRGVLCLLRRVVRQEQHRTLPLLAGAAAGGMGCLLLDKQSRQTVALFLLARAIDITYQDLVRKGYLPKWDYFYVALYSLTIAISGYAYSNEPGCIPPDLYRFYLNFADEGLGDLQMRQVWVERMNRQLAQRGIAPQDPLAYMPKLKRHY
jgi:hypothetical protein